ncbi:MAG: thiamine phosphate synthase [Oscillospiraceae bacterium]|nr:thiamine phosphate synthase [Oscillospiraceae bacterium]
MKLEPSMLRLYAITDRGCIGERDFLRCVEAALRGGVTMLQLREKGLDDRALIEEARQVGALCREYGVPLIVNDNYRAALEAGADGVHVGIEDAPVAEIRALAGEDFLIGATAKTVAQAQAARAAGADYLGVGAVFPSPTKQNAVRITPAQFREIKASVTLPAVAIGGITRENLPTLRGLGADGFAVVSAIFAQEDIEGAARELRSLLSNF